MKLVRKLMKLPDSPPSTHAIAYYELSKHRDGKFRNLIMMKLSEPLDHKENAYLDSKFKDQLMYLHSTSHSSDVNMNNMSVGGESFDPIDGTTTIVTTTTTSAITTTTTTTNQNNGDGQVLVTFPSSRETNNNNNSSSPVPSSTTTTIVGIAAMNPPAKFKMPQISNNNPKTITATANNLKNNNNPNNNNSNAVVPSNNNNNNNNNTNVNTPTEFDINFDESTDDLDDNKSDSNKSDLTSLSNNYENTTTTTLHPIGAGLAEVSKTIVSTFFQNNEEKQRPLWTHLFHWQSDEKLLLMSDVTRIQLDQIVAGTLILTNRCIYFHYKKRLGGLGIAKISSQQQPSSSNVHPDGTTTTHHLIQSDKRWYLDRLTEAYGRRYLSQNCAIELFFANSEEVFLAFPSYNELMKFFKILRNQNTPLLTTSRSLNPRYIYSHSSYTELWKRRQISNFEYLMKLNIMAGRSYNDITQYPVYPWILSNYLSETMDLNNKGNYRDLSKPMGALNEERLKEFKERYNSFYDDTIPKFMYGSHYSSAGVVLHYMVRQEPYTTLAINLQSGRFDCPDRIFFNLSKTWHGCNHSMSDVKELIPEMYYCPEIFTNSNRLPLGELQDGNVVDNVVLPPWCHNDPYEFIRIHREALESDYVSEHLHEWIDLIFGFKQRGDAALTANNVFYYLTYENSIDISAIEDQLQREATKSQVIHFGQTPSQLLNREHPKRLMKEECTIPICNDVHQVTKIQIFTPYNALTNKNHGSILFIRCIYDKLYLFHHNFVMETHRWAGTPDHNNGDPFTLRFDKLRNLSSATISMAENLLKEVHLINHHYSSSHHSAGGYHPHNHHEHHQQQQHPHGHHRQSIDNSNISSPMKEESSSSSVAALNPELSPVPPQEMILSPEKSTTAVEENNDIISPSQISSAATTSTTATAESSNKSVFSAIKNSFWGNRRKSTSVHNTEATTTTSSSSLTIKTTGESHADPSISPHHAGPSTTLYNAMRIDQKLHPDKKLQSPHHHPHHSQGHLSSPLQTLSHSHSHLHHHVKKSHSSSSSSPAGYSILDTCSNGLNPMSAKFIAFHEGENLSQARIISCGYWDNTIKVHALDSFKEIVSVSSGHLGAITCLEKGSGQMLVTGGFDGTIRVWVLEKPALASAFRQESFYAEPLPTIEELNQINANNSLSTSSATLKTAVNPSALTTAANAAAASDADGNPSGLSCIYVLCGHSSPISALSYSADLDVVLSGGSDGLLCVHTVRRGQYVRCMNEMIGSSIDMVLATNAGYLIAHSWTSLQTRVYWINGQLLHTIHLEDR
jgi:hypothetical protein